VISGVSRGSGKSGKSGDGSQEKPSRKDAMVATSTCPVKGPLMLNLRLNVDMSESKDV
jgi:hypothetical protein